MSYDRLHSFKEDGLLPHLKRTKEKTSISPEQTRTKVECDLSTFLSHFLACVILFVRDKILELAIGLFPIRDLKQARTATAVNKQLNFTVKNKPHTTNYIYCIFEAYFMIKSV